MPKVSVIVPIYNTEKYLPRCINSILEQSFTDFELILVNDGSTDRSIQICTEYAEKDSRIVIINKENEGANYARRDGTYIARGKWIMFVDSDDSIENDAIKYLITKIDNNTQIVIGQLCNCVNNPNLQILDMYEYCMLLLKGKYQQLHAKLFSKELLILEIFKTPREIILGEDYIMNIRIAFNITKSIVIIPEQIYNYNSRHDSIMHSFIPSINYECMFWQELINAISPTKITIFEPLLFQHAYIQWCKFCEYKIKTPIEWRCCKLNQFILVNYPKYKTTIPIFNRILINTNNLLLRFFLIYLKKACNNLRL